MKNPGRGFFSNSKINEFGLVGLNLDIWNNVQVHQVSGYTFEDIKRCLLELVLFISNNLSPNRLEGFDLEAIHQVKNYYS